MARRFGPTQGAGVVVIETPPDKTITPAPTGVTCYIGQVEKGDTGEIIACATKADYVRKCGGFFDGSQVPDSAFDFYNLSNGAGELFVVRITDETEVDAASEFWGRQTGHGAYAGPLDSASYNELPKRMLSVAAKNGGRWAGRKRSLNFTYDEAADLTDTTVATGVTMLEDEFAGASLTLDEVTGASYKVLSNTTAGVLTVESDSTMFVDSGSPASTNDVRGVVHLDTADITFPASLIGTRKGLSIEFGDGQENEDSLFSMRVYEDEQLVLEYLNLSMDPSHQYYVATVVNEDTSNFYVTVTVNHSGSISADTRPANFYGQAEDWASNVLTAQYWSVASAAFDNDNAGWVGDFAKPSGSRLLPQRLKLTYVSATTKFTVESVDGYGHEVETHPEIVLSSGVGSYASPDIHTPSFEVYEGAAGFTNGDIITIDIHPFPVDADGEGLLKGGFVYYDVGSDKRARLKIDDNDEDTITLVSEPAAAPTEAAAPSSDISGSTLTFALTVSGTALQIEHSGVGFVTLDVSGSHASAAALAAALNTAWQSASGSSGNIAADSGSSSIDLSFDALADASNKGLNGFIRLVHNSTATELGFSADAIDVGTVGAEFRVQARTELRGGHDGGTPSQAQYLAAANTVTSVINRLFGRNKGLVKLALPGISSHSASTAIQRGFIAYAEARNYQYRIEMPSTTTDDGAAIAYINDTIGRNDFAVVSYPSHGYVPNPLGDGVVLRSLTGSIHGREALVAGNFTGYHKAAAGIDVTLPNVSKVPTGERVLNEEALNPVGINVIKKARGNFILWGDRTISLDPGWKWKHQREQMSHYENIMREEFDFIIFAINDAQTQQQLVTTFQAFFIPEWQKRALRGDKFTDAVSIKIDGENNTNLTRANGDLNAEIKLRLADTVERFIIRIGKAGIFEDLG